MGGECMQPQSKYVRTEHSGQPTHVVRAFFTGAALERLGPDLLLCEGHALDWNNLHPFGPAAEPIASLLDKERRRT